jgi:hypothetical protein
MSSLYLWIFGSVVVFIFSCWGYSYFRYWHVGYGMALVWKEKDGTVWVTSRLVNSPAGRSDIQNRTQVSSINGTEMFFKTGEDFLKWFQKNKPRTDTEDLWKFTNGLTVKMTPVWIWQKVPDYWSPNQKSLPLSTYNGVHPQQFYNHSFKWCEKTNQRYMTKSISPNGFQYLFFGLER